MKIDLKTTILLSSGLALALNLIHFATNSATKDAFVPSWAYTASSTPTPAAAATTATAGPAKLPLLAPAPATAEMVVATASTSDSSVSAVAARLSAAGLNPNYAALYLSAQQATGTPWQLIAAVHKVETNQSGDTTRSSSAGAT